MNEAKSFIEYATNRLQYVNTDMWNDLRKATEFYSQPFSPLLIDKYFIEWGIYDDNLKRNSEEIKFVFLTCPLDIDDLKFVKQYGKWSYIDDEGEGELEDISTNHDKRVIKTLDDFINDCVRDNLPLTFSQTALNELNINIK